MIKDINSSCQASSTVAFFQKSAITPKMMAITPKTVFANCFG